jgi:hypothetical protein
MATKNFWIRNELYCTSQNLNNGGSKITLSACSQELYGQPTQPAVGTTKHVDIYPVVGQLTVFACNVKWLQDNGYLVCDNHNGMSYSYLTQE